LGKSEDQVAIEMAAKAVEERARMRAFFESPPSKQK
jgi:hypothetical protein